MPETVLVTGATGFIAQHCIIQLLEAGYRVRGTVRSSRRSPALADVLAEHLSPDARLDLSQRFDVVEADLTSDQGWPAAVGGCRYVLHVASPFLATVPDDENDLIVPARDGTVRVLRAAHAAGVERVVLTSSVAAVWYGRPRDHVFTELDWSDVEGPNIGAYEKSKTLAERAAWEFMATLGTDATMDLVVINPGAVLGPVLEREWSTSGEIVKKLLDGSVPAIPDIRLAMVDVRDVAAAHVAAMTTLEASGRRFLCCIESHSLREIAQILAEHLDGRGFTIPSRSLPTWLFRMVAWWDPQARLALSEVGQRVEFDNHPIHEILGFAPRDLREMTVSMADSMIRYGVVAPRR